MNWCQNKKKNKLYHVLAAPELVNPGWPRRGDAGAEVGPGVNLAKMVFHRDFDFEGGRGVPKVYNKKFPDDDDVNPASTSEVLLSRKTSNFHRSEGSTTGFTSTCLKLLA